MSRTEKRHKAQRERGKLETYLALNRQYTVADYLSTVSDKNLRKILTMYRLSDHSLAVEKGRHRQTWLPREERLCCHCDEEAVETELHFLTQCNKYTNIREEFFPKIEMVCPEFKRMTEKERLPLRPLLLGVIIVIVLWQHL